MILIQIRGFEEDDDNVMIIIIVMVMILVAADNDNDHDHDLYLKKQCWFFTMKSITRIINQLNAEP